MFLFPVYFITLFKTFTIKDLTQHRAANKIIYIFKIC